MKNKSKLIFISLVLLLVLFICLPTQVNGWGSLFGSSSSSNNNNNDNDDDNNDNIQEQNEENNDNNNIIPEKTQPIINKQPIKRKNAVSEDVENNENAQAEPTIAPPPQQQQQQQQQQLQALTIVEQVQTDDNEIETKPISSPPSTPPPPSQPSIFEPEDDWKEILPGQHIPGGLDVRMNLQTGKKYARLMPETASSSTHWSNKRNKNLKGEDVIAAEEEEAIIVADHAPIINNKTSNNNHRRLDINNLDEDEDLSPLDAEMKSAQMIERVLNGLPL